MGQPRAGHPAPLMHLTGTGRDLLSLAGIALVVWVAVLVDKRIDRQRGDGPRPWWAPAAIACAALAAFALSAAIIAVLS